jgi:hypothetical protein
MTESPYFPADQRKHLHVKILEGLARTRIPEYMHDGILMYLLDGIPPGDFLAAVINNDLAEACRAADDTNIRVLVQYVRFFYNDAPALAWGRTGALDAWCALHQAARDGKEPGRESV